MTHDFQRARVIVRQRSLEFLSPSRSSRRQATAAVAAQCKADGHEVEARVKPTAAAESDFLRIEFVEVMQDATYSDPLVIIQGMFKYGHGGGTGVHHQIFADEAARIREAVGEFFVRGKQEKPRSLRAIGANDHGLGFLP